jgi:hypothetical protein
MDVLSESPEMKSVIISAHGMLPILEILETCSRRDVIPRLLKIVNAVSNLLSYLRAVLTRIDHLQ